MHTHAYDVSVQFGAEIWATAKTEKKIKNAIGLVAPSPSSDISYSTALQVVGLRLEESGQGCQDVQRYHFIPVETLCLASVDCR
jgi:hypothetical protein